MNVDRLSAVHPHTVAAGQTLREAAGLMRNHGIGSLPVLEGERAIGVVTDRDIALEVLCEGRDPDTTRVRELVHGAPVSLPVGTTLAEAARCMRKAKVRRLPIVTGTGRLISIVTYDAVLARLADRLHSVGKTLARQLPGATARDSPQEPRR